MAADGALPEDHQVARQDIGAFHRDPDRHALPSSSQVISGTENDPFSAMHIHCVSNDFPGHFSGMVLGYC